MVNNNTFTKNVSPFMLSLGVSSQVGIIIIFLSSSIGRWLGFGHPFPNHEFLDATFPTYDGFMDAWGQALLWEFTTYLSLIIWPKWKILRSRSGPRYTLWVYFLGPWLTFFLIENDFFRYLAFIMIAAGAYMEGVVHPWLSTQTAKRQMSTKNQRR